MNYEKIKSGALALLVIISLTFTWGIWNYQPSYETITDSAEDTVAEVQGGRQLEISDLLKPSKIISHQGDSHYGTVSENELSWVMDEMGSWTFFEPENVSNSLSEADFDKLLSGDSHVELFFSSSVPFNTIKTMLRFREDLVPNAVFNRIVITEAEEANKAFVYFVSVEERLVFKSEIEARSLAAFKSRYMEASEELEPYIAYQVPNGALLYVRENPPVLTVRNSLTDQIDADTFRQALFSDPSYVRKGSNSGSAEYTDGSSLMRINSNTGIVEYVNLAEITQSMPLDQLIDKSITYVNNHKGWVNDYRLFQAEPGSAEISYRLFMGDYPVFNSSGMDVLSQIWGKERIYEYNRSSYILELLPDSQATVALPGGKNALDAVLNQEDIDPVFLTDMRIGYEMTVEQESSKIFSLKPFWFYEYNGNWVKLESDEGGQADGLE